MDDEMSYSVSELAGQAGVTVRALHHYDEIGLLSPSHRTPAGYRKYSQRDAERLYRILVYRELGFDLAGIAAVLDDPDTDALDHLRRQRALLEQRVGRLQRMLKGVEAMMNAKESGYNLTPDQMREVFGDFDPTEHAAEAEARWGESDAFQQSKQRTARYGKDDWLRMGEEAARINDDMAAAMRDGIAPTAEPVMAIAERHRQHITRWFYECGYDIHTGLGETYVADPRFAAHYENQAPGLSAYFRDAILANAERARA
jgi:DNA-binding transcriptional MerR regulator